MRTFLIVCALQLAACAPAPRQEAPELAAPTPADVSVRIGPGDAGAKIEIAVGQRFAVELIGTPTAGYVWAPARLPAFVTRAGETTGPTLAAQNQPGFVGGRHWEVFLFAAIAPGSGELAFEQRRPWESDEAPADTFAVTIEARASP